MKQGEIWLINLDPTIGDKESAADCFQVRSLSQERFVKRLGLVSNYLMDEVRLGLSKVLSIDIQ